MTKYLETHLARRAEAQRKAQEASELEKKHQKLSLRVSGILSLGGKKVLVGKDSVFVGSGPGIIGGSYKDYNYRETRPFGYPTSSGTPLFISGRRAFIDEVSPDLDGKYALAIVLGEESVLVFTKCGVYRSDGSLLPAEEVGQVDDLISLIESKSPDATKKQQEENFRIVGRYPENLTAGPFSQCF